MEKNHTKYLNQNTVDVNILTFTAQSWPAGWCFPSGHSVTLALTAVGRKQV